MSELPLDATIALNQQSEELTEKTAYLFCRQNCPQGSDEKDQRGGKRSGLCVGILAWDVLFFAE
jgi:hypothetical protein